jgi:hypothetical protein
MQNEQIGTALNRVWQAIGADILECNGGQAMPRAEVVEIVMDANYLEMYSGIPAEDIKAFRALPYDEQDKIATAAFTYASYGY